MTPLCLLLPNPPQDIFMVSVGFFSAGAAPPTLTRGRALGKTGTQSVFCQSAIRVPEVFSWPNQWAGVLRNNFKPSTTATDKGRCLQETSWSYESPRACY